MGNLKGSAQRVQNKLRELGYTNDVVELPGSTRTAQDAARAIGCEVAQIAKSLIFRLENTDNPLLVVACGVNRVRKEAIESSERYNRESRRRFCPATHRICHRRSSSLGTFGSYHDNR